MFKLSIPKPCHVDWGGMTPNVQGRHCVVCAKTVVDFTKMSDDDVKNYFLNRNKGERTCGRFRTNQISHITIELPADIYYIQMPLWKKFLAASLIIFGATLFSCNTTTIGKPLMEQTFGEPQTAPQKCNTLVGDTALPSGYNHKVGELVAIDTMQADKGTPIQYDMGITEEVPVIEVQGDISIDPRPEPVHPDPAEALPVPKIEMPVMPPVVDTVKKVKKSPEVVKGEISIDTNNCNTKRFY